MREDGEAWSTAGSAATVGPGSDASRRGGRRRGRGPQHWLRSGRVAAAPATMPPEKEAALIMRPPCRVSDSNITSHHPLSSLLLPSFVAGGRGGGQQGGRERRRLCGVGNNDTHGLLRHRRRPCCRQAQGEGMMARRRNKEGGGNTHRTQSYMR